MVQEGRITNTNFALLAPDAIDIGELYPCSIHIKAISLGSGGMVTGRKSESFTKPCSQCYRK